MPLDRCDSQFWLLYYAYEIQKKPKASVYLHGVYKELEKAKLTKQFRSKPSDVHNKQYSIIQDSSRMKIILISHPKASQVLQW